MQFGSYLISIAFLVHCINDKTVLLSINGDQIAKFIESCMHLAQKKNLLENNVTLIINMHISCTHFGLRVRRSHGEQSLRNTINTEVTY